MKARIHPLRQKLRGEDLRVPGDKSISHRSLLFTALAEGESRVSGLAPGGDVRSTARCLGQLGVPLLRGDGTPWSAQPAPARPAGALPLPERDSDMGADDAIVLGVGLRGLREPTEPLDCGNSGTTMRLFTGVLAGAGVPATLIGDASLSRRPMERVAAPLRELGASVTTGEKGRPPVRIERGSIHAGAISSKVASAQVKSAVLLAGLFTEGETSFTEPLKSRDHTERMLRQMGAAISVRGTTATVRGPGKLHGVALDVPGDLSSAAFLLAAALAGGSVSLDHVGVNPTRAGFLDALSQLGARVELRMEEGSSPQLEPTARLSAQEQSLRGAELSEDLVSAPSTKCRSSRCSAPSRAETVIRGAEELRVKESDRIAQMAQGLRAMGADVDELPDGLRIRGGRKLHGAEIDSAHDHRIALAFSVAGLAADSPTTISGAEWADVSFPGFYDLLRKLGAEVELSS
jgi:3-phosphoshikimate 1-carboxyvinyltransferase